MPNNLVPEAFTQHKLPKSSVCHHPLTLQCLNRFPIHLTHFVSVFKTKFQLSNLKHNVKSRKHHQKHGGQSSLSFLNSTQRRMNSVTSLCQNSHRVSGKDLICVHETSSEEMALIWYKRITDCFRKGREVTCWKTENFPTQLQHIRQSA
jgi:hypothetical protein